MKSEPTSSPLRHWSAIVPVGMSLAALGLVLVYGVFSSAPPQEDEGAPARIFQMLMIFQMPVAVYFAIRWLPQRPRPALAVLVLQGLAWLAALAALYYFEHT